MSSLANQQQNLSFSGLLRVPGGVTSTLQQVQDGNGNPTGLSLSSAGASVTTSDTFQASNNGTTLTGALPRLISDGFGDFPTVKDFGAVGDGVTDDTAAFQKAIDALTEGGTVNIPVGKYYLANTIIVKSNVTLQGVLGSVGGQAHSGENFNNINNIIYLASTATIQLINATSIKNIAILASNLRGVLPFASSSAAAAGVAAFTGVGINCTGSDIYLAHLIILGFTTAIKSNDGISNKYRQKFEWIDIDCTNGIDIYFSADVPRIANIHCWDFLTFNVGLGNYSLRSGTAFKVSSNFDNGSFIKCFAWGYAIGFDIAANIDVTLLDCAVDSWAANPNNPLQKGVNIRGTVDQVKIIGGSYSGVDKAVNISTTGSVTITGGAQFFGNKTHIFATAGKLRITGCAFNYLNSIWSGTTAIQLTSGVTSPPLIIGNQFDYIIYAYVFATGASSNSESATIWGNGFSNGSTDPIIGERLVADNGNINTRTFTAYNSSSEAQTLNLRKSRGTIASPVTVNSGDALGSIQGTQWNGSAWVASSGIRLQADGVPSSTSTPGSIILSTVPAASTSQVDRISVNNSGWLFPLVDNAYQLGGGASFRWASVWAANGTIQTSDLRTKDNISDASLGLDFINTLRPVSYTWKQGSVEVIRQVYRNSEGEEVDANAAGATPAEIITKDKIGTRTHWGLIAQEVKIATDAAGVDFGGWILSDLENPDSQQALRYDQFIAPMIKAIQELTARIAVLESK